MNYALKCGKLFDSQACKVLQNRLVLVEDNKISDVLGDHCAVPEGFTELDLSDRFVMPGLIDAHVHTTSTAEPNSNESTTELLGDVTLRILKLANQDLQAGFTTLRDAGGKGFCEVAVRNAINRGEQRGPRMLVAGYSMGSTGGHADSHYSPYIKDVLEERMTIDSPADARRYARYNLKYGADFLKFMSTGGVLSRGTTVGAQQLTADEIAAIIEIAEMYGVHTATHAHGTSGIKAAVRAGVTSVEHGMMLDDEAIDLMLEHGTYLTPTIIAAERIIANGEGVMAPWAVAKAKQVLEHHEQGLRKCLARGVKLTFGTDSGTPYNYHGKQGYEFELMCRFGFTPIQALTAATKTNSELLRMQDQIGSVEKGKLADIVAFEKDPTEDIKTMTNCVFVMKDGQVVKN